MTTARDIVKGALRHISVANAEEEPSAVDMADGVTSLNDMIASWSFKGIHTGAPILAENDPFPFEDGHVAGVKAMLAQYIASDYGMEVPANIVLRARSGWQAIQSDFGVKEPLRVDPGLSIMPSMRRALD